MFSNTTCNKSLTLTLLPCFLKPHLYTLILTHKAILGLQFCMFDAKSNWETPLLGHIVLSRLSSWLTVTETSLLILGPADQSFLPLGSLGFLAQLTWHPSLNSTMLTTCFLLYTHHMRSPNTQRFTLFVGNSLVSSTSASVMQATLGWGRPSILKLEDFTNLLGYYFAEHSNKGGTWLGGGVFNVLKACVPRTSYTCADVQTNWSGRKQ